MLSPNEKNSRSARIATIAAKHATSQVGHHQIDATTAGISIAAVAMRRCVEESMLIVYFLFWPCVEVQPASDAHHQTRKPGPIYLGKWHGRLRTSQNRARL